MGKQVVSVIVPFIDEPPEIFQQVVNSVLNQTHEEMQLILIDDGSKDGKLQAIVDDVRKDSRVTYRRRERKTSAIYRTCSEAYNLGLNCVEGDWVCHNAGDDYFEIEWAERLMKFVEGREEVNGLCTNWIKHWYDGREEFIDMKDGRWDWKKTTLENYMAAESLGGWLFKWDWVKEFRFDERFPRKQTREYMIRVFKKGNIEHYPKYLWHFTQWKEDHAKYYASIRWRILADLKNGIYDRSNLLFAITLSRNQDDLCIYYAALDAYSTFMNSPDWKEDYEASSYKESFERVRKMCFQEALAATPKPSGGISVIK